MNHTYLWRCPECREATPSDMWEYVPEAVYCNDDIYQDWHPGHKCPICGAVTEVVGPPYIERVAARRPVGRPPKE